LDYRRLLLDHALAAECDRPIKPRWAVSVVRGHWCQGAVELGPGADAELAVLTGRTATADVPPGVIRLLRPVGTGDMARVSIAGQPLTATAALVWNGDLPRPLQQILFDTADAATAPAPASPSPAS